MQTTIGTSEMNEYFCKGEKFRLAIKIVISLIMGISVFSLISQLIERSELSNFGGMTPMAISTSVSLILVSICLLFLINQRRMYKGDRGERGEEGTHGERGERGEKGERGSKGDDNV